MTQAFRGAFARMKGRFFFGQWVGNFLLMLLAAGWIQVPDSHSWQFVFSMVSGVGLVAGLLWLYTSTFRYLSTRPARPGFLPHPSSTVPPLRLRTTRPAFWFRWLLLQSIAVGRAHEGLFAGYWNSQSPPWLRSHFGYSALVAWQERLYDCLQWLCAGLLLPPAVETCGAGPSAGWFGRAARVYRHWLYWLCVLACGLGGAALTWALAGWASPAGLAAQTLSIVLRLGAAYTIDIFLWCFVLGLVAHYLDRPGNENPETNRQ